MAPPKAAGMPKQRPATPVPLPFNGAPGQFLCPAPRVRAAALPPLSPPAEAWGQYHVRGRGGAHPAGVRVHVRPHQEDRHVQRPVHRPPPGVCGTGARALFCGEWRVLFWGSCPIHQIILRCHIGFLCYIDFKIRLSGRRGGLPFKASCEPGKDQKMLPRRLCVNRIFWASFWLAGFPE